MCMRCASMCIPGWPCPGYGGRRGPSTLAPPSPKAGDNKHSNHAQAKPLLSSNANLPSTSVSRASAGPYYGRGAQIKRTKQKRKKKQAASPPTPTPIPFQKKNLMHTQTSYYCCTQIPLPPVWNFF